MWPQRWYHSREQLWFYIGYLLWPFALSLTIQPQFAIECLWALKSTGGGLLWGKIWGEKVDLYKPKFDNLGDMGLLCVKEIVYMDMFCHLSTMHKQTDHRTVTSFAIGKITCQRYCLKCAKFSENLFCTVKKYEYS